MIKKTIFRRSAPEVNAGSMADIAFLLLIFFLVTTTIMSDSGILVKLPPWQYDAVPPPVKTRNILRVAINGGDELLVRTEALPIAALKDKVKEYIMNPNNDPDFAESSNKAIISLVNDRSTTYDAYLAVYNELKAAYSELWEEAAQRQFKLSYLRLSQAQQLSIRNQIPFVLSEAEPTDHLE